MRRAELLQGLKAMMFKNFCGCFSCGELTQAEADELLGVGEQTFRRWCLRYREEGADGLRDRRIGTAAANRVHEDEAARVEALCREGYRGFTAKHFHEHLARTAWFHRSYTWTKLFLHSRGLSNAAPRATADRVGGRPFSEQASTHSPFLYFEDAPAFCHVNGMTGISFEVTRLHTGRGSGVLTGRVMGAQ